MSTTDLKGSYRLQSRALGGAGFQKVQALVEDLRLLKKKRKNTLSSFTSFICGCIYSVRRQMIVLFSSTSRKKTKDLAARFSSVQEMMKIFRAAQGAETALTDKTKEGEFTLVISHFVSGLGLTGQRRAGRERQ